MTHTEAAKQALEALEWLIAVEPSSEPELSKTIAYLRQTIAEATT